jgi:hypothetical protein
MKKLKVFLVSVLAMLVVLICFVGCGVKGVWRVESYEIGGFSKEVEESSSYIEFKGDNAVTLSISVGTLKFEGDGTWSKGEEKDTYVIDFNGAKYIVKMVDDDMIVDFKVGKIVLDKD